MDQLARSIASAFEVLVKVVVPLYVDDEHGRPQLLGTGFFIRRSDGSTLLVSAGHVLDEGKARPVYYYSGASQKRFVTGRRTTNRWSGSRENDLLDLAAVLLEGDGLPPYPAVEKYPLHAASLHFAINQSSTARYGAIGFPASKSRVRDSPKEVRVAPYGLLADLAPPRDYACNGLHPKTNLYLVFNRKKSFNLHGQGQSFPKPHGLSGAPVFELYDEGKSHQGEGFPLAGVVTTWKPQEHRLLCASAYALRELVEVAA
jgi:hypothetical protein